ncbi:polygalacturonase [Algoriphagus sp. 4150]|uniref:hypothetical protein n=1 Tax=Algoriphagus sp. 4150 TaxID=2817756 RepID=UPI0028642D3B|nr:hypothetical protein [Algoriphagus sp. 4150]MDR7130227.1 polygalacturonase [Algoriphagus sp. 4150]
MIRSIPLFTSLALMCMSLTSLEPSKESSNSTGLLARNEAPHIVRVTDTQLILVNGSTYLYSVDTPEGEGLISTKPTVEQLLQQLKSAPAGRKYRVAGIDGVEKKSGLLDEGDHVQVVFKDEILQSYELVFERRALGGRLWTEREEMTVDILGDLVLYFTAGQRSSGASVSIDFPRGVEVTMENTSVNVIGRGDVKLKDLKSQSIGKVGSRYSYDKVGEVVVSGTVAEGMKVTFKNLDLRPLNGFDLKLTVADVKLQNAGEYQFSSYYSTREPERLNSAGTLGETTWIKAVNTVTDFKRVLQVGIPYHEIEGLYSDVDFHWSSRDTGKEVELLHSEDNGSSWKPAQAILDLQKGTGKISGLSPQKLHLFRLSVKSGPKKGLSNPVSFFSGKKDIKEFGVTGKGAGDDTDKINEAITYLAKLGGGTLLISPGEYHVRTVQMKSNVWLYLEKGATIMALKGADAPEMTWFSDKKYRSGLSPTDLGPYLDPENYLTKQDVGHTYFQNTMFFGERLDNVKVIGNGRITGNGNLVTSDRVMNNTPDNRADKMFTFKLCTHIEIGGVYRQEDVWYDEDSDEPYYIGKDGEKDFNTENMLDIDQGGHFVLLATGSDHLYVHNTYFARHNTSNVRDIYDFMACNDVVATNIYSKVSSDDVVKLGSDCSLGFTRPVSGYLVRNLIGDTNCNLFQIGSETADDIQDVHVDNMYVLGANKAGFSISTNDGAQVKDIHLNCGHTGTIHSRSKMLRARSPFFISISNRARILGAEAGRYKFDENGTEHDELLIKNVNIGKVENILINGVDISEVYGGSSHSKVRWKAYDGNQNRATPILAGYKLPNTNVVEGGLDFTLPNGKHTGYIENIVFDDVHVLVKGGNPASDSENIPAELGVGQYNVSNLKVLPSYGLWARHVKGLRIIGCTFNYENRDNRPALYLDDVVGAEILNSSAVWSRDSENLIKSRNSSAITIDNIHYYRDFWGNSPKKLSDINQRKGFK